MALALDLPSMQLTSWVSPICDWKVLGLTDGCTRFMNVILNMLQSFSHCSRCGNWTPGWLHVKGCGLAKSLSRRILMNRSCIRRALQMINKFDISEAFSLGNLAHHQIDNGARSSGLMHILQRGSRCATLNVQMWIISKILSNGVVLGGAIASRLRLV